MADAASITTQDDYQHVKTGGIYTVISTATMEATGELVVVYRRSEKRGDNNPASHGTWVRPMSEFADGRFIKMKYRRACGCDIDETCICDDPDFK